MKLVISGIASVVGSPNCTTYFMRAIDNLQLNTVADWNKMMNDIADNNKNLCKDSIVILYTKELQD